MAQLPLTPCVCEKAPGSNYCLDCEQYFCDHCKTVHRKIKSTQNHSFQSAKEAIPEVKSRCEEHDEAYNFYCTSCNVPVCVDCITGKHNGHKFKKIQDIVTDRIQQTEERLKPEILQLKSKVQEVTNGRHKFQTEANSVIKQIKKDRKSLQALIKSYSKQLISEVLDEKKSEITKLHQIEDKTKKILAQAKSLEESRKRVQSARPDATSIKKIKLIHGQIDQLEEVPALRFPTITYRKKEADRTELAALMGVYQLIDEELIASASAIVWLYDNTKKNWVPSGNPGTREFSTVKIYKRNANQYRFEGRKNKDKEVVMKCWILKSMQYTVKDTFHHFAADGKTFGLVFINKDNANEFGEAALSALQDINSR